MPSLYASTANAPFIAEVQIIQTTEEQLTFPGLDQSTASAVEVAIIDMIKGSHPEEPITVAHQVTSCSADQTVKSGETYFVAGRFKGNVLWSGPDLAEPFAHVWK